MKPLYDAEFWEKCAREQEEMVEFNSRNHCPDQANRCAISARQCWERARMAKAQSQKTGWEILQEKRSKTPPKAPGISMEDYLLHKDNLLEFFRKKAGHESS